MKRSGLCMPLWMAVAVQISSVISHRAAAQTLESSAGGSATRMNAVESGPTQDAARANQTPATQAADQAEQIFRAPLLREGSAIIEVPASITRDADHGWWKLNIVDDSGPVRMQRELLLMPCTRFSEMRQIVEASPNVDVQFQVTGRIFVFRGRNYVLLTHATALSSKVADNFASTPARNNGSDSESAAASSSPDSNAAQTQPANASREDSATEIMNQLEHAAGPMSRNIAAAPPFEPAADSPAGSAEKLVSEETSVVNRRGKLTRDAGGGWTFVFDADANGLADPPMRLMPCLLLERIEDYARRQGNNSPALINGAVYLYNGQNYLLPTVFRIPQDRRNLSP